MIFPLEILPVVALATGLFNMAIGLVVFFPIAFVVGVPLAWTAIVLPLIVAPFALFLLGMMWFLAAVGAYVRDTAHAMNLVVMLAMFLSPLFYPSAVLPEQLRPLLALNPVSLPMEAAREAVLFGTLPDPLALGAYALVAAAVAALGHRSFRLMRGGFADVV